MNTETEQPLDKRNRAMRLERIVVGEKTYLRNDICAQRFGESERVFNKRDRDGAPFQFFAGVKYRPVDELDEFILSGIRSQKPKQQPKRRRVR